MLAVCAFSARGTVSLFRRLLCGPCVGGQCSKQLFGTLVRAHALQPSLFHFWHPRGSGGQEPFRTQADMGQIFVHCHAVVHACVCLCCTCASWKASHCFFRRGTCVVLLARVASSQTNNFCGRASGGQHLWALRRADRHSKTHGVDAACVGLWQWETRR